MTDQLIAPVIPSAVRPARRRPGMPGRTGAGAPLPMAGPPATPSASAGVVYGMGRIDASGRVADRTITRALNWRAGDRVSLTGSPGVVLARRDPHGLITLPARPYVAIPAGLRHRCGLHAGDRVLLAAALQEETLTAYSLAVVDQALRAQGPLQRAGGGPL